MVGHRKGRIAMKNAVFVRLGSALMLAPALLAVTAASAQVAVPRPPRATPTVVPCCRCIGGNSTANVSTGQPNATWTVTQPGNPAQTPTMPVSNVAWTTTAIPGRAWISPQGNPTTVGTFDYSTTIDVRNCIIGSTVTISGRFLADNRGTVLVDGREVGVSSLGTPNYGFLPGSVTPFSVTLPAGSTGLHTITLRAQNSGGPTGILVEMTVTRQCGDERQLEVQPPRG
jgi:hypothetical protein